MQTLTDSQSPRARLVSETGLFFALAYGISWTFWSLIINLQLSGARGHSRAGRVLYFAGIQGPFLAGFVLSIWRGGPAQVRRYYATIVRTPVNPVWFVMGLCAAPSIALTTVWLAAVFVHAPVPAPLWKNPVMGWPMLIFGQLLIMHGEEYGWRGYALPRMEIMGGPLGASTALGVLWAVWHLPLFFTSGSWQSGSLLTYALATVAISIVQAAIFFRAHRSTLAAQLFHGALNATEFTLRMQDQAVKVLPWVWTAAVLFAIAAMPRPWFGKPKDGGACEAQKTDSPDST